MTTNHAIVSNGVAASGQSARLHNDIWADLKAHTSGVPSAMASHVRYASSKGTTATGANIQMDKVSSAFHPATMDGSLADGSADYIVPSRNVSRVPPIPPIKARLILAVWQELVAAAVPSYRRVHLVKLRANASEVYVRQVLHRNGIRLSRKHQEASSS